MDERLRPRLIVAATLLCAFIVAMTEALSAFALLVRSALAVTWGITAILLVRYALSHRVLQRMALQFARLDNEARIYLAIFIAIAAVNVFLALVAAPSALDALSYHAPRISHWIQNRSVAHYPTHIDRQLWVSPGYEFVALQLQALIASDRLMNTVQWAASIGCAVVASQLARELGAARRGQLFAALFSLTLPMGVAQASGSQVDLFAAFWVGASVVLILRIIKRADQPITIGSAAILGACLGLAALAKSTAYVFLFPFVIWLAVAAARRLRHRVVLPALVTLIAALAINAGHSWRNYALYGNPLRNPRGEPVLNEIVTVKAIASNVVRNVAAHAFTRSAWLNSVQERAVARFHRTIGIELNDPRTTFFGARFRIMRHSRTEGWAGNPAHLFLFTICLGWILLQRFTGRGLQLAYAAGIIVGGVLFCALLKWQPWNSRFHLSLFILAAGLVGAVLDKRLPRGGIAAVALVLLASAGPTLIGNRMRPLVKLRPIHAIAREQRYFIEAPWTYEPHVAAANFLAARNCGRIGLVTSWVDWEHLLWVVMRNRMSDVEIVHTSFTPDETVAPDRTRGTRAMCAIVSVFEYDFLRPPAISLPPTFQLALDRGVVRVYVARE